MSFPMDVALITVTATYIDFQKNPQGGTVIFTPSAGPLADPTDKFFLEPIAIPVTLNGSGSLSVELPCTSNSNFEPSTWAWQVTERISGSLVRSYYVELPSTLGETVDLTDLAQVVPPSQYTGFLQLGAGSSFPLTGTLYLDGSPPIALPSGTAGDVLTSDSSGNLTLQPGSGGIDWVSVKTHGATGNGQVVTNASVTASSSTLTAGSSVFASGDVGKLVMVTGAGASGVPLAATITGYTSGTQVTLSANASTSVSSAVCYWGTDDSAAFQSALTAASASVSNDSEFLTSAAQCVYVPYAIYMSGSALVPVANKSFRIIGGGAVIVTPQSAFINFNAQTSLLEGTVEISGLWVDAGGGHIFTNANLHGMLHVHHMNFCQRNPGYAIWWQDDVARGDGHVTALYKATFSNITYWQGPGTRTVEMWHLVSNGGASLTDITWEHINGPNPPGSEPTIDSSQYQYYLTCSGGTNDEISNITWRNVLAASFYGGFAKVGAATQVTVENVNIFNTYGEAETNDLFAFINDPVSGQPCKYVTIRNVHRNNNLGSAGSPACNDVSFTSACSWIRIENYTGPYYGGQGPTIALNGAARAVIENCGGTAGTLSVTGKSADTVMIQNGTVSAGNGFATLLPSGDSTGATDAALLNAAITAGQQNIILGAGQWYFGTNRVSLTAGPGVKILGSGSVMNDQASTNATVINCGSSASATGLFFFSHTATLISGTEIGNLDIVYSGTGNVFDDLNCQSTWFHDLNISLSQNSAMAFAALTSETANNSVIQVTFDRVTVTNTATARTNPWIMLQSENSGGISDVTFSRCKFNNSGQDNAQPVVLVECTATGGGYHYATTFRDCYFEKPLGGAIRSLSGSGLLVDHCMFWDMSGLTIGGSTVYAGQYSGNPLGSQGVKVTGCGRNRSGPNGSSYWDVECDQYSSQVVVEGWHILPQSLTTQTNAFFNFRSCVDALVIANTTPQGSGVNGNSTTVISNPPTNLVQIQDGTVSANGLVLGTALPVPQGGTGNASLTAYAPLLGGSSPTGALTQATSGMATAGYVLTSNGSGALPTFQAGGGGGTGPTGPTGPAGPAGPTGLVWYGAYSNTTTYAANDAVLYNGSAFIATAGTTGVNPGTAASPNANWNTLASIGNTGPMGTGVAGVVFPTNQGFLGWSFDPVSASGAAAPSGGQLWGTKVTTAAATTTGIAYYVNSAGATLTTGECYIGLFDHTGTLQAVTGDCSGATYTVSTTASSATVTGTGFIAAMVGAQYTIAGVSGTFTVSAVGSSTSLTMTATVPTGVSGATMTPVSNFSWLSTGEKYTPWAATYSASNDAYWPVILAVGTTIPKFECGPTGLPTTLIGATAPGATGEYAIPRSIQAGGLSGQTSIPSSVTMASSSALNTTFWLALY